MKALIVDDEPVARARLRRLLEEVGGVEVVGEAGSGTAALELLPVLKPEVLLLDVEMPGLDGLALAERPDLPPIIFTTAHPGFAADAFDVDAVDYLVKPVRKERLEKALAKFERRRSASTDPHAHRLTVHSTGETRFVDVRQVTAFRALDKYTELRLGDEELLVRESLDTLQERFAALGFVRVHRGTLVRRDAVVALERDGEGLRVKLTDGRTFEVSRRQAAELKRELG
ncbi:MAG: response regulator transcription factor [Archangiaceae bacterium]|nr:response regulator transcription factor [Archangiaceae bacterium]